ncbi:MAG: hypothetical protein V2B19_24390, partial [Pseudomonadota bacterium]
KHRIHAHKGNKFWSFAFWCFEFVSDFDIRISDFSAIKSTNFGSKILRKDESKNFNPGDGTKTQRIY